MNDIAKIPAPDYMAVGERRAYLLAEAEKLKAKCKACGALRALNPADGCCGPCHYGCDLLKCQPGLKHGDLCDDCAFRPGSPEREPTMAYLHLDCSTELELVLKQTVEGSGVFHCHKPFLEPEQEWGYDPVAGHLIPLEGDHWRPCGGWVKAFGKAHGLKQKSGAKRDR